MCPGTLVPAVAEVELVSLGRVLGTIEMRLKTCRVCAACPACATSSRRVQIAANFRPAPRTRIAEILETLTALGQVRESASRYSM
jgi:hypothetical protein